MNVFHSAAVKLTLWYLAIIMLVSIGTSAALYHVSSNDLRHSIRRQINFYSEVLAPEEFRSFSRLRASQLNQDLRHLKQRLIFFNLTVLVGGGLSSYALARRTMRPLEDSLEAQTRFTGDASHELRTPLSVMQTEIEVALRNPKLAAKEARSLLQSNLEEVALLKSLSEGLLQLAGNTSDGDYDQPIPLKKVAAGAIDRIKKTASSRNVNIKNSGKDILVRGNHESLVNLVYILLDNAVKYSPRGSDVAIETGQKDRRGYIRVSDHGEGIAAADLPRIFERFYRADSSRTKTKAEGYGLGLAIAKKIADLHHGSIEVKSTLGKGSIFTIYIPKA